MTTDAQSSPSSDPVAVITGAGSGIGRALAVGLAQLNYRLVLGGRTRESLSATAALTGADCEVVGCDVSDPVQAQTLIARAVERFGRVDALVNNAGDAPLLPIDKTTPEALQRCFAINALAPGYTIAAAWPHMVRQRSGCIVNVSTLGTIDPFPGFFAYAAAKAAVNLMARSCANEGKRHAIRAFAVAPGAVETAMLRKNFNERSLPPAACLAPSDVAGVIIACLRGERDAENGQVIVVKR